MLTPRLFAISKCITRRLAGKLSSSLLSHGVEKDIGAAAQLYNHHGESLGTVYLGAVGHYHMYLSQYSESKLDHTRDLEAFLSGYSLGP